MGQTGGRGKGRQGEKGCVCKRKKDVDKFITDCYNSVKRIGVRNWAAGRLKDGHGIPMIRVRHIRKGERTNGQRSDI